ncbi:MAG: condensation domain-containing protein, partial [Blastocatellia bacterium]
MSNYSENLASLSSEKRRLLEMLLSDRGREGSAFPLSYEQQRLWFLEQMEPGSATYNIGVVVRVSGRLDVESLRKSVNEVIRRHETLRTRFATIEGQGMQVVGEAWEIEMEEEEIEGRESEREGEARKRAIEECSKGFNIEEGPLLRMRLMRIGEEERIVVMVMHHIISDGWSSKILVEEIGRLYEGYRRGEGAQLEELRIQYGDYAVWQREWLKGELLEKEIAYWKRQLEGASEVLELSKDRERPESLSHRGGTEAFSVEEEVYVGLKELSQRAGVTLFITLLAAFDLFLSRHSGQEDIIVGSPVANRGRSDIEGLIGFFTNMLVLRTNLSGDPTFIDLVSRVRESVLGAQAHLDLPFEKLVDALQRERSLRHSPLFQVCLAFDKATVDLHRFSDITISPIDIDTNTAKFDLTLSLIDTGKELIGRMQYAEDLYYPRTVALMIRRFKTLLSSIVTAPEQRISRLN